MARWLLAGVFVLSWTGTGWSESLTIQRAPREAGPREPGRQRAGRPQAGAELAPARPPIRDAVEGFYVNRIQRELRLSDEQFSRVLPTLRRSLARRNELALRQVRARSRLRQALQRGTASEAEIATLRRELDETNSALRNVQEEFFAQVDPELTEAQRANLRIVLPNLEARIRNMIERSRNAAPADPPR